MNKKDKKRSNSNLGLIGFLLFVASYFPIVGSIPYLNILFMIVGITFAIIAITEKSEESGINTTKSTQQKVLVLL